MYCLLSRLWPGVASRMTQQTTRGRRPAPSTTVVTVRVSPLPTLTTATSASVTRATKVGPRPVLHLYIHHRATPETPEKTLL